MAPLRRTSVPAPLELLEFEPDDWPSWDAWHEARFEYLFEHPLGDVERCERHRCFFEDGLA
jgi:hypothetical protein